MPVEPIRLARHLEQIAPFRVMAILEQAQAMQRAGVDVIHLEVGEPDFPTPEPIMSAAQAALRHGQTSYTPAAGLPALREALANDYRQRHGITLNPRRILVTPGATGALQLALALLIDAGDSVLLTDPGYPCNRHLVSVLGGQAEALVVEARHEFQPTPEQIQAAWHDRVRVLLLASPANPTGTVASMAQLRSMHQVVRDRQGVLVVDEIYQGLLYDGTAPGTALTLGDDVLVIGSFSKYYHMTGWRLGWVVVPESAVDAAERLAQNLFLAPSTVAQHAALAAFTPETEAICRQRCQQLDQRRRFLLEQLPGLGFHILGQPVGAFYLYADVATHTEDAESFCQALLQQQGVALTPGIDFGVTGARSRLRLAYAADMPRLCEAVTRIRRFLGMISR